MTYLHHTDCSLEDFKALLADPLPDSVVPQAETVVHKVPVYNMANLSGTLKDPQARMGLMAEWAEVLADYSGVVVLKNTYSNTRIIDEATDAIRSILQQEKDSAGNRADHFAAAGSNDRIWNSHQKLARKYPEIFLRYMCNPAIDAVCESWLGPNYQMTAQVNLVYPGGEAQKPHRDYHLGFQTDAECERYPAHVHTLSPLLTLQGAIAHCDMTVESGVTKLLPFSQRYAAGYLAYRRTEFREYFEEHYIQLPLKKGDSVFFNPALFHAAGSNQTNDVERLANLLQVSSALGRAMETLDRKAMCVAIYQHALEAVKDSSISELETAALIAATAEGYAFPTNLDTDPPVGGLAPESQQACFKRCLNERVAPEQFARQLETIAVKQRP